MKNILFRKVTWADIKDIVSNPLKTIGVLFVPITIARISGSPEVGYAMLGVTAFCLAVSYIAIVKLAMESARDGKPLLSR